MMLLRSSADDDDDANDIRRARHHSIAMIVWAMSDSHAPSLVFSETYLIVFLHPLVSAFLFSYSYSYSSSSKNIVHNLRLSSSSSSILFSF